MRLQILELMNNSMKLSVKECIRKLSVKEMNMIAN